MVRYFWGMLNLFINLKFYEKDSYPNFNFCASFNKRI
jgi:hypothetical protein